MNADRNVPSLKFLDFYNPIKLAPWPALTSVVIAKKSKYAQACLTSTMQFHDPQHQQGNFYELLVLSTYLLKSNISVEFG